MIIKLLLIIPLIGSLLIAIYPTKNLKNWNGFNKNMNFERMNFQKMISLNRSGIQMIALITSLVNFVISLLLIIQYNNDSNIFQFVYEILPLDSVWGLFLYEYKGPSIYLGIDGLSLFFVLLTTLITPICILASWNDINHNLKYFFISFLILETLQIAVFVVLDLLLFYIFFESVLIPLFFIVGIWGASLERIRASYLLFLYTLLGSLFMLLAILVIYNHVGSTDLQFISLMDINFSSQILLWLGFFISFAVKTPLVPFHLWLFRAHAEAPLAGSIILAAIILKLATYGFLRIMITILPDATYFFLPLIQTFSIITLIYSSLATLRQIDLKALVAYSSVAHMAVVILGLFSNTIYGIEGGIALSIAHGFVSPALFICVGGILYMRYHSRIVNYYRGIALTMPLFTTIFFIFTIFNTAIPLSLNWIGEFLALAGTFENSPIVSSLGATGIVLSACYSVWMYNRISYGSFSPYLKPMLDINRREFHLLLPLLVLTLVLGIYPNIIFDILHLSVANILYFI